MGATRPKVLTMRQNTNGGVESSSPAPSNPLKNKHSINSVCQDKSLDTQHHCGYIHNMKDRNREKNSMVHVRFTENERRKLKAICALKGVSMQEYIRELVQKALKRGRK